jgi:hypothetical protein
MKEKWAIAATEKCVTNSRTPVRYCHQNLMPDGGGQYGAEGL